MKKIIRFVIGLIMMSLYLKLLDYIFSYQEQLQDETDILNYSFSLFLFLVAGGSFIASMLTGAIVTATSGAEKLSVWFIYSGIFTLCVYALLKQQTDISREFPVALTEFICGFFLGSLIPVIRKNLKNKKYDT